MINTITILEAKRYSLNSTVMDLQYNFARDSIETIKNRNLFPVFFELNTQGGIFDKTSVCDKIQPARLMPKWRNWQTRYVQVVVGLRL